ncbi:MAG: hypothetical protein JW974_00995 [Alphaproteobacteria bacterium]|nr:hypothetical protein [Alphaproteobacteria bacterium]MBN2675365.1 hypothetical protein [Alphaproteobacteria bacterium]
MNDFLLAYYKQLNFNSMPAEIRAQYDAYAKSDDFRGNMGHWKKTLLNPDGSRKDLPDATDDTQFDQGEWNKLFNAFQTAFRSMDASKNSFKDNKKANEFLAEYFGDEKLFSLFKAPQSVKDYITTFVDEINKNNDLTMIAQGVFENRSDYVKFLDDIKSNKYNSDAAIRDKLIKVVATIYNNDKHNDTLNPILVGIYNGFDDTGSVETVKLEYFKRNYNSMLRILYTDTKVREVFSSHDNGKISKSLNEALEKTDYTNKESKDYIPPKRIDELTLGQQVSNWWAGTYEDYLEKYTTLRGDRLHFSQNAKFIVKAIDGAKIKPTDGLEKVLSEAENIKKNLLYKSPKASEAFEYFIKIMGELKSTMPKAFAGALHNGWQMRALVEEMIISSIKNGKTEQAKVAMEVLSIIKYGYTTSKIMDAIGKEKMTIFSDPSLSWNKTEGIKFVTTALDKSLKTAFMGVGYGITIVGNSIKQSGIKFNGKTDPRRIGKARNNWNIQNTKDKAEIESLRDNNISQKNDTENDLAQNRARGINEANLDNAVTNLNNDITALETSINTDVQFFETWVNNPANIANPDKTSLENYFNTAGTPLPTLADANLQTRFNNFHTNINQLKIKQKQLNRKKKKQQYFKDGTDNINFLSDQITKRDTEFNEWDDKHKDQYMELMAYWDFLETGSYVKSWALGSKKAKQIKFDNAKNNTMQLWQDNYTKQYAA